ncbi:protein translocase subunit SecD [Candidatus Gottesmanbacteria bacterium]|nr:protein translocase subunit SecD [Candidatus Gottesmanbacteria bacterium]
MLRNPKRVFFLLFLLTIAVALVDLPYPIPFVGSLKTRLGLDLSGGSRVVLSADMNSIAESERGDALQSARAIIDRRINFFGVSEPTVQTSRSGEEYRIIVEMPGVTNANEAIATIGQTARLEFREFRELPDATSSALTIPTRETTKGVDISGSDLKKATVTFSTETGEPQVAIEFIPEGTMKFGEVTTRLVGKPLAIFLDDFPIMWPMVKTPIMDGAGIISGGFSQDQARQLAIQLNAGALPVPVSVIEQRSIGPTLGADSVEKSIQAGVIGLVIVAGFMVAKYGRLGLLADGALVLYGLLTFALYRIIPVTLTLPGITGFLLSIGMAVDSNILIFERFSEEKRLGKPWYIAIETAFGKAWESIRDANVTTILTCIILYNPGNWQFLPTSGLVRGFALTLFLGVLISLFTGIVVTRTLIRVFYKEKS